MFGRRWPQKNVSSLAEVCFMNMRDKWSCSRISLKRQRYGGMLGIFESLPVEWNRDIVGSAYGSAHTMLDPIGN